MFTSTGMGRKLRRFVCLGMLVAMLPLAQGCYGHFPITHAVYNMNGSAGGSIGEDRTQHKLVQSVLFWVLWIIPVYQVSIFADAVVLNLIEFWTGDTVNLSAVQERDGSKVALQSTPNGHEAVLTISSNGKTLTEQHMVKVSATIFEMRDASGNLTGTFEKMPNGNVQLSDAQGKVVRTLTSADMAALPRN
ncbi:TPA: hypothetical protein DDW35_09390 [Candidatus Sumerlaeota bacterium]|jgi:hypothetical protein|nr:hypothetical protein [Candidatus Sumerlaeota bacterium]